MTDAEYRAVKAVSNSGLGHFERSPLHYQYFCRNEHQSDSEEKAEGRLAHCHIFEPNMVSSRFQFWDESERPNKKISKSTGEPMTMAAKENKRWLRGMEGTAKGHGKTLLHRRSMLKVEQMREALMADPLAADLINAPGEFEKPFFWTDETSGIECKGKLDKVGQNTVVDYKTVADASKEAFMRFCQKYGTHRQGAFYCDGSGRSRLWFIAQEKKPPYAVHVFMADDKDFIQWGRHMYKGRLIEIAKLRDEFGSEWGEKIWPGYGWRDRGASKLELPEWYIKRMGD